MPQNMEEVKFEKSFIKLTMGIFPFFTFLDLK